MSGGGGTELESNRPALTLAVALVDVNVVLRRLAFACEKRELLLLSPNESKSLEQRAFQCQPLRRARSVTLQHPCIFRRTSSSFYRSIVHDFEVDIDHIADTQMPFDRDTRTHMYTAENRKADALMQQQTNDVAKALKRFARGR